MSTDKINSAKQPGKNYGAIGDEQNNRQELAQLAFESGDPEESKRIHDSMKYQGEQHSEHGGDLVKAIVFGGLDGIITTFATVTSVYGAQMSPSVILVLGIAHLFADGLSMGMGNFLGDVAEMDLNKKERAREAWELINHEEGEKEEMYEVYEKKGMKPEDARTIVDTMSKYHDIFVDTMMFEELQLIPMDPDEDTFTAAMPNAIATMISFMIFGCVPLLSYVFEFIRGGDETSTSTFNISIILTVCTLYLLGYVRGKMTSAKSNIQSGLVIALNGSAAAVIGYFIGYAMKEIMGLQDNID